MSPDRDPDARRRDVAVAVGITERAVQQIVRDLVAQGYLLEHRRRLVTERPPHRAGPGPGGVRQPLDHARSAVATCGAAH